MRNSHLDGYLPEFLSSDKTMVDHSQMVCDNSTFAEVANPRASATPTMMSPPTSKRAPPAV